MDKLEKTLQKLTSKERERIKEIFKQLEKGVFANLDIKKLKGREDIFRLHKGKLRIIYRKDKNNNIFILSIERRNNTTYNF